MGQRWRCISEEKKYALTKCKKIRGGTKKLGVKGKNYSSGSEIRKNGKKPRRCEKSKLSKEFIRQKKMSFYISQPVILLLKLSEKKLMYA